MNMRKNSIYESVCSGFADNWMEQERRYEAKHSPWELDDNAAYLDEEHRRHCEAREARKAHERECEVKRPEYDQSAGAKLRNATAGQLKSHGKTTAKQAEIDEAELTKVIVIIVVAIVLIVQFLFM